MKFKRSLSQIIFFSCLISCWSWQSVAGQNWPRFRGINGQGMGPDNPVPIKWQEQDFTWQVRIPGIGHASPVIWQNTIYVTSADDATKTGYLSAVSIKDGQMLWQKTFALLPFKMNPDNSYAAATPAVDQDFVYIIWYATEKTIVIAVDHKGKPVWQTDLDGIYSQHGPACSPVITADAVIFTLQQEDESPFPSTWVALNRLTGKIKWKLTRTTGERNTVSTPCLIANGANSPCLLFTSESHGFTAVDPSDGKVIWELNETFNHRTVASPVLWYNLVIGTCKQKLVAVELPGAANNNKPVISYELKQSLTPYVPTPIVVDDLLFLYLDNGNIACCNVADGKLLWKEKPADGYYGSPVLAGGNLYAVTKDGNVVVIKPSGEYQLLMVNSLGEGSYATPAVSGNTLIFKTFSHLIAVRKGD